MKKTWVRLLAMFVTGVALFAGTWYGLKRTEREQNKRAALSKPVAELLIGAWVATEQDPPLPSTATMRYDFSSDGKVILTVNSIYGIIARREGRYTVFDNNISIESIEGDDYHSWSSSIGFIDIDQLVFICNSKDPRRIVLKRCNS